MLITAVTTLVAVVGVLWRKMENHHTETVKDLRDQRKENKETNGRLIDLTEKVGHLEGHRDGVDDVASALIKEIRGK